MRSLFFTLYLLLGLIFLLIATGLIFLQFRDFSTIEVRVFLFDAFVAFAFIVIGLQLCLVAFGRDFLKFCEIEWFQNAIHIGSVSAILLTLLPFSESFISQQMAVTEERRSWAVENVERDISSINEAYSCASRDQELELFETSFSMMGSLEEVMREQGLEAWQVVCIGAYRLSFNNADTWPYSMSSYLRSVREDAQSIEKAVPGEMEQLSGATRLIFRADTFDRFTVWADTIDPRSTILPLESLQANLHWFLLVLMISGFFEVVILLRQMGKSENHRNK